MSLAGFDTIQATPNARDLLEGFNATSEDELEAARDRDHLVRQLATLKSLCLAATMPGKTGNQAD